MACLPHHLLLDCKLLLAINTLVECMEEVQEDSTLAARVDLITSHSITVQVLVATLVVQDRTRAPGVLSASRDLQ